jgi:hypothetical protein
LWWLYFPVGGVVLAGALFFWWLVRLQGRTDDLADRVARLEGGRE